MDLLEELRDDLEKKINEARYQNLKPSNYNIRIVEEFDTMIQEVNKNINSHNKYVDNFSETQKEDRKKFQEHLVSSFLYKENYFKIMEKAEKSNRRIKRYDRLIEKTSIEIDDLKLKISSVAIGKDVFEKHIKTFLNNDKISIDITKDDKFKLMRDGRIAKNLSEGEKTAISFSYFLVTLDSLHEQNLLKEHIIFIDDPISSLDAQHIAQVYSIINSFFFRQNENPDNPEEYVSCFKQLFISTHNYEFFSFLKDSNRINKRKGKDKIKMHEYYLIKKKADGSSVIENMPKSLSNYKSEYIYLFDIIFDYYKVRDSNSNLILLPNAIRRFLEIYTLIKLPGSRDEVDGRMNQLFGGANNLKALHHFSHFTSFDKIMKHDEIIMHLPNAVEELISILNKDEEHFLSLKQAIK